MRLQETFDQKQNIRRILSFLVYFANLSIAHNGKIES